MGVSSAVFESAGKRTEHYVPGVYSRSYNVTSPSGISSGNLCILGKSTGGKPHTLLEFSSLAEAKDSLVSGELLEGVGYAFNGSDDYVPQKVYAMRVNTGTQSTCTLSSGDTEVLKLSSWDYGSHTNQLKIWVQTGSTTNSKKITTVFKDNTVEVDDIIRESLSLSYVGEGENPTVTVTNEAITMTATVTTTDDDGNETSEDDTLTISFDDVDTIEELVTRINDSSSFSATSLESDSDAEIELDTVTNVDIADETVLYSNFQAVVDALEDNEYIGEGNVEILSDNNRVVPDDTDGYVYFSDGSAGSYTTSEWSDALEALEKEDVQIIATPVTTASIQNLIATHCKTMSSTVNRKERTCLLGGALDESDTTGIARAKALASKYASYVVDSATVTNPISGDSEEVGGAILAIMLAGMESGMSVNEPLTNKTLSVLGFSTIRSISNMEKLIKAGVMVCNPNPDDITSYVCIRAITTYQGSGDLISCERSMTREDLYMNRDLRNRFASSIGRPNAGKTSTIIQTLKDAAKEWANMGYIIPSDSGDNVWDIKVSVDADKNYLTFSRYLTAPTNFIFITAINKTYSSTVEV